MKKYLLILSQKIPNESINMLIKASEENPLFKDYTIVVWELDKVSLTETHIKLDALSGIDTSILISEIVLVIKRTWGPIRKKALAICEKLEDSGVVILNGCQYIGWTHSKIKQYETFKEEIFPKTVCFDKRFMALMEKGKEDIFVDQVLGDSKKSGLSLPLVFKTDEGCRTDGVFLVESRKALKDLLNHLFSLKDQNKIAEFRNGFLLQEFIKTHEDSSVSSYFRVNVVGGKAQSAVQFQMKWVNLEDCSYKQLKNFGDDEEDEEMPINLSHFDQRQLKKIVDACPENGVVGADVVCSIENKKSVTRVLEFNDGPAISPIGELGEKYKNNPDYAGASKACIDFPSAIMSQCLEIIQKIDKQCVIESKSQIQMIKS